MSSKNQKKIEVWFFRWVFICMDIFILPTLTWINWIRSRIQTESRAWIHIVKDSDLGSRTKKSLERPRYFPETAPISKDLLLQ